MSLATRRLFCGLVAPGRGEDLPEAVQALQGTHSAPAFEPAEEDAIDRLTELVVPELSCTICMEDETDVSAVVLPCDHAFHRDCLVTWLQNNGVCPLCRASV